MTIVGKQAKHLLSLSISLSMVAQAALVLPVQSANKTKTQPSGTLLLPLTPKIDDSINDDGSLKVKPSDNNGESGSGASDGTGVSAAEVQPALPANASDASNAQPMAEVKSPPVAAGRSSSAVPIAPSQDATGRPASDAHSERTANKDKDTDDQADTDATAAAAVVPPVQQNISAEAGTVDGASSVDENSLLKGTVQITADDTEYDQDKNTFLGTGNAVAIIAGQNSRLEADTIVYDQNANQIDARGSVKINRNGQLTTGTAFKFKVDSDEYLITDPNTELNGTQVVARFAKGEKEGLAFQNGTFTMPHPFIMQNNAGYGPMSEAERYFSERVHPDAYAPQKPSFKFTARKMVYEKYKEDGQLTVYGGKLVFDHFTVPLPKFNANVGGENRRIVFPISPVASNNLMVGGANIGPSFNYAVGKYGAFTWAPLIQIGGRSQTATTINNNTGKIGLGAHIGYSDNRMSMHLAYGTNSNLLVADLKYKLAKSTYFQAGINRYLNDGMFGVRRARLLSEVYDQRAISKIPYISALQFRTSAGWAQDDPGLVTLAGSNYSKLFQQSHTGKVGAYKAQEQIMASTHPIFTLGNQKYGGEMTFFAAAALRAYSTGDRSTVGQVGPSVTGHLGNARLQAGYAQSTETGSSPFVYDEFIQGSKSTFLNGDLKVNKWLTLGTSLGYNLDAKLMYQRAITAAIGPDDLKFVGMYDQISGTSRVGFDVMYGQPVNFKKLVMKSGPDAGQLGGI